jgi:hypothetical protein
VMGAHLVQRDALASLKVAVDNARWYPSRAALEAAVPGRAEALRRITIAPANCPELEVRMTVDGEKTVRRLDRLDEKPRDIYFAILDPAISKVSVDLPAESCVAGEAWAALGDGTITPLQMFDPEAAFERQTLRRLFSNLVKAFN